MTEVMLLVLMEVAHDNLKGEDLIGDRVEAMAKLRSYGCVALKGGSYLLTDKGQQCLDFAVKKAEEVL